MLVRIRTLKRPSCACEWSSTNAPITGRTALVDLDTPMLPSVAQNNLDLPDLLECFSDLMQKPMEELTRNESRAMRPVQQKRPHWTFGRSRPPWRLCSQSGSWIRHTCHVFFFFHPRRRTCYERVGCLSPAQQTVTRVFCCCPCSEHVISVLVCVCVCVCSRRRKTIHVTVFYH